MSLDAALYVAVADDRVASLLPVAARPLGFRVVMAAVRAGAEGVLVPASLRGTSLEGAIARTPSARARVVWIAPGAAAPAGPLLLLPASGFVTAAVLRPLVERGAPAALDDAHAPGAPVAVVPAAIAGALWPAIAAGEPLGDVLERALADARIGIEPTAEVERIGSARDAARLETRLFAALGSPIDTRLDVVFHRRLSLPLSLAAVRLGLSPNVVTLVSLAVGLGAVACFWQATTGMALAGLILYALAVILDHADGEVARLAFAESAIGEWLDVAADTVIHTLLVVAMGLASQRVAGAGGLTGAVAALGVVASAWLAKTSPPAAGPMGGMLNALGNRDGFYAMLAAFIAGLAAWPRALPALMLFVAVGCHAYWLGRVASRLRAPM